MEIHGSINGNEILTEETFVGYPKMRPGNDDFLQLNQFFTSIALVIKPQIKCILN